MLPHVKPVMRRSMVLVGALLLVAVAGVWIHSRQPAREVAVGKSELDVPVAEASDARAEARASETSKPVDESEAMRQEMLAAESFREIHDRLIARDPAQLRPFEQFYLAYILETCQRGQGLASVLPDTRGEATAPSAERQRAREYIEKRSIPSMCAGIVLGDDVQTLVASLYEEAARRGDPRAVAWKIQTDTLRDGSPLALGGMPTEGITSPAPLDEGQRQALMGVLQSRDPIAIAFAGRVLSRRYEDVAMYFGPDRIVPSARLNDVLWDLASCDFGANCSPRRLTLELACASRGQCGFASYEDYLRRNVLTPQDMQDYARIRPYLTAALRRGDWSGIGFGPTSGDTVINAIPVRFGLGG